MVVAALVAPVEEPAGELARRPGPGVVVEREQRRPGARRPHPAPLRVQQVEPPGLLGHPLAQAHVRQLLRRHQHRGDALRGEGVLLVAAAVLGAARLEQPAFEVADAGLEPADGVDRLGVLGEQAVVLLLEAFQALGERAVPVARLRRGAGAGQPGGEQVADPGEVDGEDLHLAGGSRTLVGGEGEGRVQLGAELLDDVLGHGLGEAGGGRVRYGLGRGGRRLGGRARGLLRVRPGCGVVGRGRFGFLPPRLGGGADHLHHAAVQVLLGRVEVLAARDRLGEPPRLGAAEQQVVHHGQRAVHVVGQLPPQRLPDDAVDELLQGLVALAAQPLGAHHPVAAGGAPVGRVEPGRVGAHGAAVHAQLVGDHAVEQVLRVHVGEPRHDRRPGRRLGDPGRPAPGRVRVLRVDRDDRDRHPAVPLGERLEEARHLLLVHRHRAALQVHRAVGDPGGVEVGGEEAGRVRGHLLGAADLLDLDHHPAGHVIDRLGVGDRGPQRAVLARLLQREPAGVVAPLHPQPRAVHLLLVPRQPGVDRREALARYPLREGTAQPDGQRRPRIAQDGPEKPRRARRHRPRHARPCPGAVAPPPARDPAAARPPPPPPSGNVAGRAVTWPEQGDHSGLMPLCNDVLL